MDDKTTNPTPPFSVSINPEILDTCRAQAVKDLEEINRHLGGAPISAEASYPFGGTFSVAAGGYAQLSTVKPMEFTSGVKLTYFGKGGGLVFGGGVFAGGGLFTVDPDTLDHAEISFLLAGTPGVGGGLSVTWFRGWTPIGNGSFLGLSAFIGAGGGNGQFQRA